jgi:hypothetical protein
MKGARFQRERERERDHELFEYGVLVTHVFKVRDFRKRETMARWTVFFSRTRSLVWRDLRKRKTMARGRRVVLVAHVHQISLIFEKKTSYATFDTHSSNSYTGQDANFQKTETMR